MQAQSAPTLPRLPVGKEALRGASKPPSLAPFLVGITELSDLAKSRLVNYLTDHMVSFEMSAHVLLS
jgi:hypothetical protein